MVGCLNRLIGVPGFPLGDLFGEPFPVFGRRLFIIKEIFEAIQLLFDFVDPFIRPDNVFTTRNRGRPKYLFRGDCSGAIAPECGGFHRVIPSESC